MFQDNLEKHVFFSDWLLNLFVVFLRVKAMWFNGMRVLRLVATFH